MLKLFTRKSLDSKGTALKGATSKSASAPQRARGQIAIFMVFVFQVLFILLGMTINVGMTVFDKINFQNSLDLAAYYGAKKQAEVLNAMAHINYQMRQNWKLLSWRYRILGTLTQKDGWPGGTKEDKSPSNYAWCPQNKDNGNIGETGNPSCNAKDNPYYFVCVSHSVWKRGVNQEAGDNICQNVNQTIPDVTSISLETSSGPISLSWAQQAMDAIRNLQNSMQQSCPLERALNYLTAQLFLTHARLDQKDRKTMIKQLYKKTLFSNYELADEPNKSIEEGVKKVFYHNLSESNRSSVQSSGGVGNVLKQHNSFEGKDFGDIFDWINVYPILNYLYIDGLNNSIGSGCTTFKISPHMRYNGFPADLGSFFDNLTDGSSNPWVSFISPNIGIMKTLFKINNKYIIDEDPINPLATMTLGFYKRDNTELYYGLYADMEYQKAHQLFGLWGGVKFKASSFAKPFGGRFGPRPLEQDERIRCKPRTGNCKEALSPNHLNSNTGDFMRQQPNYSRWPGDDFGLVDSDLHYNQETISYSNFLNKQPVHYWSQPPLPPQVYTVDAFLHIVVHRGNNSNVHDPLARPIPSSGPANPFHFMRIMELMAVWPDAYDIAHYTILGNYMGAYFPKVCKLLSPSSNCYNQNYNQQPEMLINSGPSGINQAYVRGDFGWTFTNAYMQKNRDETDKELSIAPLFLSRSPTDFLIDKTKIYAPGGTSVIEGRITNNSQGFLTQGRIFYPWLARDLPGDLLSSWVPTSDFERYGDYNAPSSPDSSLFMKCNPPVKAEDDPSQRMPVPSSCVGGGRSGYSVKLISCDMVKNKFGWNNAPAELKDNACP